MTSCLMDSSPEKLTNCFSRVNDQVGHFGNTVDALDDGVFAATALDVLYFNLESLCHFEVLLNRPLKVNLQAVKSQYLPTQLVII
jgi:hypothetical protein